MTVVATYRGSAAHRKRVQMLRELHEARLVVYVGLTQAPTEFVVRVSGREYRFAAQEVLPWCAGFALGLGKKRSHRPLAVETDAPLEYLVEIDGVRYRLAPQEAGPFLTGFSMALGKEQKPLPVIMGEIAIDHPGPAAAADVSAQGSSSD